MNLHRQERTEREIILSTICQALSQTHVSFNLLCDPFKQVLQCLILTHTSNLTQKAAFYEHENQMQFYFLTLGASLCPSLSSFSKSLKTNCSYIVSQEFLLLQMAKIQTEFFSCYSNSCLQSAPCCNTNVSPDANMDTSIKPNKSTHTNTNTGTDADINTNSSINTSTNAETNTNKRPTPT